MKITASAVSLNVDDVASSVRFLTEYFGFTEEMWPMVRPLVPDAGMNGFPAPRHGDAARRTSGTTAKRADPGPSRWKTWRAS